MYNRIMLLRNWRIYFAVTKVHVDRQTAKFNFPARLFWLYGSWEMMCHIVSQPATIVFS